LGRRLRDDSEKGLLPSSPLRRWQAATFFGSEAIDQSVTLEREPRVSRAATRGALSTTGKSGRFSEGLLLRRLQREPVNFGHGLQPTRVFLQGPLNVLCTQRNPRPTDALGLQLHQPREHGQMIGDATVRFLGQMARDSGCLRLRRLE
jgi:hypothetical protein